MRQGLVVLSLILLMAGGSAPGAGAAAAAPAPTTVPGAPERFVVVPAESRAEYRAGEVFFGPKNRFNVAVGTTNAVRGEMWIDRSDPRRTRVGTITVDISTLRSDQDLRDSGIRTRWLESSRFPMAEFTPTAISGLPDAYVPGQDLFVQIAGDLRIRQVSRPVTFATTLKLDGAALTGVASTRILMTDFGFAPPSLLGILKADNQVTLEFHFTARAAG
jgi:polyisoprenoid-binding protein YceI